MATNGAVATDEESLYHKVVPVVHFSPFSPTAREQKGEDHGKTQNHTIFGVRLGLEEFCSLETWQASIAELLGMASLVFAIDTIIIASSDSGTTTPGLLIAFLVAVIFTILLLATAPISGGHINPVISVAAALVGLISVSRAAIYIFAQCIGAVLGALALKAVISSEIVSTYSLGGCTLTVIVAGTDGPTTTGIETIPALWMEIICTFILLLTAAWIAFDLQNAKAHGPIVMFSIVGIVVGLLGFVSSTVTGKKGYNGAGMNPARCIGPALVRGGHLWDGHWVYWVGPAIACMAFSVYTKAILRKHQD